MIKRRDFVRNCGIASFLGIGFSLSDELAAKNLFKTKPHPFCSTTDSLAENIALGKVKWNRKNFRYCIATRDLEDLSQEVWDNEFKLAFDSWSKVTPLTFKQVELDEEFDLIIAVGSKKQEGFGEAGGILAWAQLPPTKRFNGILLSKFDLAENWILPDSKELGITLRSVAAHEIGHLLGLSHTNDPNALMYPYINNALKPRADDIQNIQKLYGKPTRS